MQRGVGRGLAATKPAWMTSGSVTSSLGGLNEQRTNDSSGRDNGHSRKGRSRSRSRSRSRDRRGGGGGRDRRRSDSRDRRRSRSRSRHRSRERRNGGSRDNGGSNAKDLAARALQQAFVGGAMPPMGRGRGRGSTIPAWMTHPDGPGGLQQSGNGSGNGDRGRRRSSPEKSPPRFARSSAPLPPEPTMANGGISGGGGGRGWNRTGGGRYGSGDAGGRGGRGGGRGGREPEKLPAVYSVHKGEVVKTESFGAFVKLDGYRKHGLVHCSQMASYRVEDVTDICKEGDTVYVKVIEVTDGADPREQRIALSMKLVNQADGADLDPSNAEAETDVLRRKPMGGARPPIELGEKLKTTCTKCGVEGHLSIDCFSRGGKKYELVDEDDPSDAPANGGGMRGVNREAPRGGVLAGGRGRAATMPAWMTAAGLADKLNKKSHRKDKKSKKKSDRHDGISSDSGSGSDDDDDGDGRKHKKHRKSSKHHKSSKHKKHHKKSSHKHSSSGKKRSSSNRRDRRDSSSSDSDKDGKVSMTGAGSAGGRGRGRRDSRENGTTIRRRSNSRDGHTSGSARRGRSLSISRGRGGKGALVGGRGRSRMMEDPGGGRFADAPAAGMGDGGRWQPRADSDRSDSRGSR
eukprot:g9300.t1